MGQVQIDHCLDDLPVGEQALDRMKMGPGPQQVGSEAVEEGLDRGTGQVEFLAGDKDGALERRTRRRRCSLVHAPSEGVRRIDAPTGIVEDQERMAMEGTLAAQLLAEAGGCRQDTVSVPLPLRTKRWFSGPLMSWMVWERNSLRRRPQT